MSKTSKASKVKPWFKSLPVDMRGTTAYYDTLESLAYTLSNEKVEWLLGGVAGWDVAINTPIECKISVASRTKGAIVRARSLLNRAEKSRWMADPEVYGHILTKAYVEHPYEKQHTEDFIKQGVLDACSRGMPVRAIAVQVYDIIDARLDCVLLPRDPAKDHAHEEVRSLIGHGKDGMVQKYSMIPLVDHNTRAKLTSADLQNADDDMKRRVTVAMANLTGNLNWVFPGSSVPAPSKLKAPAPKAKTNNKATKPRAKLPQVSEAHLRAAMIKMGIDPAAPSNPDGDPDNGYSFKRVGGVRVIQSGVKLSGGGGFSTGRFEALPGKPTFRSLTLKEFDDHVATIVKGIQRGVY